MLRRAEQGALPLRLMPLPTGLDQEGGTVEGRPARRRSRPDYLSIYGVSHGNWDTGAETHILSRSVYNNEI